MKIPKTPGQAAQPDSAVVPAAGKGRLKTSGASTRVADVRARAQKMRSQGLISQKQHDSLVEKANRVDSALKQQAFDAGLE